MTLALAGLLTTPEIQRLFAKLLLKPTVSATFVWLWSRWRRDHQAKAAKSHRKKIQNATVVLVAPFGTSRKRELRRFAAGIRIG